MKNNKLFYSLLAMVLILVASMSSNAQSVTARGNFPDGKIPSVFIMDTPGDSCTGTVLEQHDGPIHANGYTQFTDSVRFVIKFHPPSYPWVYTKYCQAFTTVSGGVTTHAFDIVVYDTLGGGGAPGALLAVFPGNTASSIANFPAYTFNSAVVNIPVSASLGAVYIGIRYNNTASQPFYVTSDEASPLWPGYGATNTSGAPSWATIQTMGGSIFPNYKCLAIRMLGNSAISPLCEQFAGSFPPTGWTEVFSGTNFWASVPQSGFGVGTGSARWDCWNGATGTRQTLFTPTFVAATGAASSVNIDVAYQPFGSSQDSLILAGSIDGGTTYTSLARLGPTQLGTTTGNASPFVPTATQWKKLNFVLPVGTNKLQVQGYSGFGDCLYVDSICVNYVPLGIGNNNNSTPNVYSLNQNYPNPFNPSTQISFGLPKSGNVKLVVFDILGREVKTLVNEFQTAGTHNITFDASSLASGIYFYSITANDFTATKKMLLIK